MQFRALYVLRINMALSKYSSIKFKKICDTTYLNYEPSLIIKCMIKKTPYNITLIWLVTSVMIFGYAIRQFEVTYEHVSGNSWSYWNGFWNVVITMTTGKIGSLYLNESGLRGYHRNYAHGESCGSARDVLGCIH